MNKKQNRSAFASALPISISIILLAMTALLLATLIDGATSSVDAVDSRPATTIDPPKSSSPRELPLLERVAHQRAIEEVYWRHRIWPKENHRPKPRLEELISAAQMQLKVERSLLNSQVLSDRGQPITPAQLQGEMDRMARDTKQPEVLLGLFAALNNDPALITECLARPILSERLVSDLSKQNEKSDPQVHNDNQGANIEFNGVYVLPKIEALSATCTDDTWSATSRVNAPSSAAITWTGSEMVVWGGYDGNSAVNTGGRYNPATDSWTATSTTNAPEPRFRTKLVWTGTEVIVWGGSNLVSNLNLNTGGRYNPVTDSWVLTSTTNAPPARTEHVEVWTGSEMIVWGGSYLKSGGRYNPTTDTWTATNTATAPGARAYHSGAWCGSEMIIWGGYDGNVGEFNTGGRYNPTTDSWVPTNTAGAPSARDSHTAIWTGHEMIVWGGYDGTNILNNGSRYNPDTDGWVATGMSDAPTARLDPAAVWTGHEMIVWGGYAGASLNTGGRYNPTYDCWANVARDNAPPASTYPAVWTGHEMIVWSQGTGGKYCVQATPTPCSATPTPPPGVTHPLNLSTRLRVVGGGFSVGIGGFIINGTTPRRVLVRGLGPSLYGVQPLFDPVLELHGAAPFQTVINNSWKDNQAAEIIATGIPPIADQEAAIVETLDPGTYTAILSANGDWHGVGLVEIYDLTPPGGDSKLANLSTRALVDQGYYVVIAGLILDGGTEDDPIIVRGLGPSLAGVGATLPDPTLELRDGQGTLIRANDNWQDDSSQAAIIAAANLQPPNNLESAIAESLAPGAYTAVLSGGYGIGLVEVYDRPTIRPTPTPCPACSTPTPTPGI